jgi:hypothetical protein
VKTYKETITLNKNNRGCYILDTVKGCSGGVQHGGRGCYGDCYAKNIADRYGFDFCKLKNRNLENKTDQFYLFGLEDITHTDKIIHQIKAADMPFIRIGEMGDPSEDWEHTIDICNAVSLAGKPIVIITKHWKIIPDKLLNKIHRLKLCINTSISALDNDVEIQHRLNQFYRLKNYCNSVLRIVSCDFNKDNPEGAGREVLQEELFKHNKHIDTVFRPSKNNPFVLRGVINTKKVKFLNSTVLASLHNEETYFGKCQDCPDMCGIIT